MSNFGDHPAGFFADPSFYNGVATQSLRFEDGSAHKLTRTFSGDPDNNKKMTISVWAKRGNITTGATQVIIANYDGVRFLGELAWDGTDILRFDPGGNGDGSSNSYKVDTTALFRDVGSWYHIVLAYDSTQGTDTNRVKLYVNGTQQTLTAPSGQSFPPQNYAHLYSYQGANNTIGEFGAGFDSGELDGYLSEFNFIDGLTLDPTYFGETKNGVWIAKRYTGSYGSNGYRLEFKNTSVGTGSSSTIGADTSGNNNHWTSSGTAAHDCAMPDSPENNFCTLNPLILTPQTTFSEGNLFANLGATHKTVHGTFGMTTGKWYWEARAFDGGANKFTYGLTDTRNISNLQVSGTNYLLANTAATYANGDAVSIYHDSLYKNGSATGSYNTAIGDNDIVGIAFDADAGKVWFHREGTWINSDATASTTINLSKHDTTVTTGQTYHLAFAGETSDWLLNAGQDSSFAGTETAQGNKDGNAQGDFYYAVPTGFRALCAANIPEPTIGPNSGTQATDHFNSILYTGNGSAATHTVGFRPNLVWGKRRASGDQNHWWINDVGDIDKFMSSDTTDGEATTAGTTFNANGSFTTANNDLYINNNSTYVVWAWKGNGTGTAVSNSDGSATTTVSANTTAGFSIITYTGTGSATTFGHGLGAVPKWIITKTRSTTGDWMVYHGENTAAPQTDFLKLNENNATEDLNTVYNDTAPTSTVFTLGSNGDVNTNTRTQVAYVWAEVEGYSKFGTYTGNGNADGTFVFLGFRPAFVMVKRTDSANNWVINDSTRTPINEITGSSSTLYADTNGQESNFDTNVDFLSNGFKARTTGGHRNASGTYIYMAFAEAPFKYSNAR